MSQTYTANCFTSSDAAQTNMAEIEENFATLRSMNSGTSAPSNTEAGLAWFDTTQNMPKVRNDADSAWLALLVGDTSQKLWIYRNDSCDGWDIDGAVVDRVIALKGGTGAYNVNGGNTGGETWANLKAHTHTGGAGAHYHALTAHNHYVYNYTAPNTTAQTYDGAGSATNISNTNSGTGDHIVAGNAADGYDDALAVDMQTNNASGNTVSTGDSNTGAQSTADVRPAAAVGTLQFPDI